MQQGGRYYQVKCGRVDLTLSNVHADLGRGGGGQTLICIKGMRAHFDAFVVFCVNERRAPLQLSAHTFFGLGFRLKSRD